MRNPATQSTVRINNQELIIEYIMENGALSRAEIAKKLNISKPTVSANVEKLINNNILKETGEGKSSGGRKPTLLNFNYDHKILISIDLNRNEPLLALSNLSGEILNQELVEVSLTDGKDLLTEKLVSSINHMISNSNYDVAQLGAVTIAIPGVINEETGEVFANPQYNLWTELNLKSILTKYYRVPVVLKNDISMAALGEKHYGIGKKYDDLVYVSSGLGVGAGLIINGRLYEGKRKAAGEVGYSRVFGLKSSDTLEERISTTSIINKIKESVKNGSYEKLKMDEVNMESIVAAFNDGDAYIHEIMSETAKALGLVVSNVALTLDLEIIILGGKLFDLGESFISMVRDEVNQDLPFKTVVKKSVLGKKAGVYGLLVLAKEIVMKGLVE